MFVTQAEILEIEDYLVNLPDDKSSACNYEAAQEALEEAHYRMSELEKAFRHSSVLGSQLLAANREVLEIETYIANLPDEESSADSCAAAQDALEEAWNRVQKFSAELEQKAALV